MRIALWAEGTAQMSPGEGLEEGSLATGRGPVSKAWPTERMRCWAELTLGSETTHTVLPRSRTSRDGFQRCGLAVSFWL